MSPLLSSLHLSLCHTVSYSGVVSGQAGQVTAISWWSIAPLVWLWSSKLQLVMSRCCHLSILPWLWNIKCANMSAPAPLLPATLVQVQWFAVKRKIDVISKKLKIEHFSLWFVPETLVYKFLKFFLLFSAILFFYRNLCKIFSGLLPAPRSDTRPAPGHTKS